MTTYIAVIALFLFVLERLISYKPFVKSKAWYRRAVLLNIITLLTFYFGSLTWEPFFQSIEVSDPLINMSAPVQGLICYVFFNFVFYWWHRLKHSNRYLWRLFHQVHHSPQRIEVLTSNYLHPLDAVSSLIIGAMTCYVLLGFNSLASAWFTLYLGVMGYFLHSNIRAPRWLGFIIQTPQMHRMHHEYNKHRSNYCDI
ncbi:desaturase [Pseudoalteromonas phenolica]|uniref:Desaturase n=1 Tax=Pseudoalteromonas phenolica TaxID=161398 RepID=A0A5R9Q1Z0_9GAMM|nr:desaturase [Pseudoalteromonas phenolica]